MFVYFNHMLKMNFLILSLCAGLVFAQVEAPPPQQNLAAEAEGSPKATEEEPSVFRDPFRTFFPVRAGAGMPEIPVDQQEPFQGGVGPGSETAYPELHVTGIVWGQLRPKAIINDRVVGIGDVVEEAEILNITRDGILLKYKEKEFLMTRESSAGSIKSKEAP